MLADGAVIPVDRTAVPVEWDEVKTQLMRLATELGPKGDVSGTSVARFIDSAANALDGNGDKLRQTLAATVRGGAHPGRRQRQHRRHHQNLQTFVTALRDSNTQIVQFEDRFATLTSVLDDSKSNLDAALTDLSAAVGEVQRFVAGSRDQTAEQIQRLANVTQNLVDHKIDLENVLHVAPNAFANDYNIYNPDNGAPVGAFVFNNFSNPGRLHLLAHRRVENVDRAGNGELCAITWAPALQGCQLQLPADSDEPDLDEVRQPGQDHLHRPELAPGGGRPRRPGRPRYRPRFGLLPEHPVDAATPAKPAASCCCPVPPQSRQAPHTGHGAGPC